MNKLMTDCSGFTIGPLIPLAGLEGERIVVHKNQIAAISPANATWYIDMAVENADLPFVTVPHARWSKDGKKLFIGTGALEIESKKWHPVPELSNIVRPSPPGKGGIHVKTVSWSSEGRYAAVLLDWTGPLDQEIEPAQILVYDMMADSGSPPVIIPVDHGEDVAIVNGYVVVLSPEITIWTFTGKEIAKLNPTLNTPFRFAVSIKEDNLALIDNDWSIRVVDANTWELKALWDGKFRDLVITDQGVIALDLNGRLHAACFSDRGLKPIGIADTGLLASMLAVTEDGRLIIMGNGVISVHSVEYKLTCSY